MTFVRLGLAQSVRVSVFRSGVETTLGWFFNTENVRIDIAEVHANHTGFEFIRVSDTASPQGDIARVSVYRSGANSVPDITEAVGFRLLDRKV